MSDVFNELITQGYEARRAHRLTDAQKAFADAVTLAGQSGEHAELAQALTGLGQIKRDLKENDAALAHYEKAVEIYRQQDNPLRLAHTIRHVADILRVEARLQEAQPLYEEALKVYRGQDGTPPLDLANALRGFALLKEQVGARQESQRLWREARSLYAAVEVAAGVEESDRRIALLEAPE
jgi:tetratricopeptide (TPR) repeat protein